MMLLVALVISTILQSDLDNLVYEAADGLQCQQLFIIYVLRISRSRSQIVHQDTIFGRTVDLVEIK